MLLLMINSQQSLLLGSYSGPAAALLLGGRDVFGEAAPNEVGPVHVGGLDHKLPPLLLPVLDGGEGDEEVGPLAAVLGHHSFLGLD